MALVEQNGTDDVVVRVSEAQAADFVALLKPRVMSLVVFTAFVGLVTALALGPGVVVNLFLKEVSGRPRPRDTVLFGGDLPFVPAGTFSDHCLSNCSFVSGEAAASFWLVGLACLLPPAVRPGGTLVLCAVAAVGASMRVMFGAHYLSDALLGGIISLLFISIVAIALRGTAKAWEIGNAGGR